MTAPTEGITTDRARRLAAELWGLRAESTRLGGWEDSNFLLHTTGGDAFVLKISPPGTPREVLENQASVLLHLASGELAELIPRIVPTTRGAVVGRVESGDEGPRWARLLTYLEGRPLVELDDRPPRLLSEIGRALAMLDLELARFEHPATRMTHEWDLMATPELAPFARHISDPARRAVVESGLDRFASVVLPRRDELESGVIHGDANDHNLLVVSDGEGLRLSGIIDLSDLLACPIIADLAICVAYLTLDRKDPVADAGRIIGGYHGIRPLTSLERELLPDLATGRVLSSVLHAAHGLHRDPDNHYLQISAPPMWRWLESLGADGMSPLTRAVEAACP
jgi:Ser/Thr protein kinase RdoA (MazF antagonist)